MKNFGRWLAIASFLMAVVTCFGAASDVRLIDAVKNNDAKTVRSLIAQHVDVKKILNAL